MNKIFEDAIKEFVKKGCDVSLEYDERFGIGFDVHTQMESECILYPLEDKIICKKRYNDEVELDYAETVEEMKESIFQVVLTCMQGRNFASVFWFKYAGKAGYCLLTGEPI